MSIASSSYYRCSLTVSTFGFPNMIGQMYFNRDSDSYRLISSVQIPNWRNLPFPVVIFILLLELIPTWSRYIGKRVVVQIL